jgi:acetolactate synthase regulatory subunit
LAELAAHTPATLSEMIKAVRRRGFRLNEIEMASALGALIDHGKAEIIEPAAAN